MTYPYVVVGIASTRTIAVSNPLGNPGITEVDVNIGTSPATAVTAGAFVDGFINEGAVSVAGSGPWTVVYPATSSGATILPQGATGHIDVGFTPEASESTAGVVDVYSLTVIVTFTTGATQTSTLTLYEGSATGITTTVTSCSTTPCTAGSGIALKGTTTGGAGPAGADEGIPLQWTYTPTVASTFTATFTPSTGTTSSSGVVTTTFVGTEAQTYNPLAEVGTPYSSDGPLAGELVPAVAPAEVVSPASPTEVSVTIPPWSAPGVSPPYYVSANAPEDLQISLADRYGNTVNWAAVIGIAGTYKASAIAGTVVGGTTGAISALGVFSISTYQPISSTGVVLPYGSFDIVTVSIIVPSGTYSGTYTGSGSLTIGYLGSVPMAPSVTPYTKSTDAVFCPTVPYCPAPGTPVGLSFTTTQVDVPVNFTLTAVTSSYTGTFSNGLSWIVVISNSNGIASVNFTSDTTLGDIATADITVPEPTTATPTFTVTPVPATGDIGTGFGTPAELVIGTAFDKLFSEPSSYTSPIGLLYVQVSLADAYGNIVTNPTSSAYQVTLAVTAGSLSATTTYIEPGVSGTAPNFIITYTAPSTIGTVSLSASTTAYAIKATAEVISVVSIDPVVSLTPPVTTSFASTSTYTATINATALPSLAAVPGTAVVEFQYSLNGAAKVIAPITSTNSTGASFSSFTVLLNQGSNTITIYATDSAGNVGSATFTFTVAKVVVTPITFTTPGAASEVSAGYTGDEVNFTNTGVAQSVNVFFVWYNSANQVVSTTISLNVSFATGQTETFFNSYSVSGTYTVQAFVRSTTNFPASISYSASVTIP